MMLSAHREPEELSTSTTVCLSEDTLLAFGLDQLSMGECAAVQAHLLQCSQCLVLFGYGVYELRRNGALEGWAEPVRSVLEPGQIVAERYEVRGLLGRGGMGEVYEASDLANGGRSVALKVARACVGRGGVGSRLLRSELHCSRRVHHPNVREIYEIAEHRTAQRVVPVLVMEFIDGESLGQRARRGSVGIAEACAI